MGQFFRSSALVPQGFLVDSVESEDVTIRISIHSRSSEVCCPACGRRSSRIHGRYQRRLSNLPLSGRIVQLIVMARRFLCDAVLCSRRIFAERFPEDILAPWARRAVRLDHLVHHLGLHDGVVHASCHQLSSGLMIEHGAVTSATERSSATLSAERQSPCCQTGSRQLPRRGLDRSNKSAWSPVTAWVAIGLVPNYSASCSHKW
jgi:zinc-finger of transposase IS204/IS1001/IS1096/IS1165